VSILIKIYCDIQGGPRYLGDKARALNEAFLVKKEKRKKWL
jgi:hypothetical protein